MPRTSLLAFARAVAPALLAGALLIAPVVVQAQTRLVPQLTLDGARRIVAGAEAEAARNGWVVSIAIVDAAGGLVLFQRADDAAPSSLDLSLGKARTAARFRRPTKALEETIAGGRSTLLALEGIVPLEGGIPIIVDGVVVGAVGVSGVTSAQDAQIAQAGLAARAAPSS